jgi:hypothetical protein
MVLEKFFPSNRNPNRRQQTKRIEEISTDPSHRNVNSEEIPLNIDEIGVPTSDGSLRGIDRRIRKRDCFCTIEVEQKLKTSLPIDGYEQTPVVSIDAAVVSLEHLIPDIHEKVEIAKRRQRHSKLTLDESTAIRLYTMQWDDNENSLYWLLNKALRDENQREQMEPWFGYLKLFLMGLMKLPSENRRIWRGINQDFSKDYIEEQEINWWSVSSCTENLKVLEEFLGQSGNRTLFSIDSSRGKMIQECSDYPNESEILLLPGTRLKVVSKLQPGPDLHIIQLQEVVPKEPYFQIPMTKQEIQNERLKHGRKVNHFRTSVCIQTFTFG